MLDGCICVWCECVCMVSCLCAGSVYVCLGLCACLRVQRCLRVVGSLVPFCFSSFSATTRKGALRVHPTQDTNYVILAVFTSAPRAVGASKCSDDLATADHNSALRFVVVCYVRLSRVVRLFNCMLVFCASVCVFVCVCVAH